MKTHLAACLTLPVVLAIMGCRGTAGRLPARPASAAPPQPQIRFTDVTKESGIDFVQKHGGCGKAYFVEQTGAGVAMLDVDADGDLDLFFPQPAWLPGCAQSTPLQAHLYLNQGRMRFKSVPGAGGAVCPDYGIGAAAGDYDDDGLPDLFVSCWGTSRLFHNEGGRFRDVTAASRLRRRGYSTSAAWLDYDRDAHLDLFVCGYVQFDPEAVTHCPAPDGLTTVRRRSSLRSPRRSTVTAVTAPSKM
jgi:enediyne biosynthesis protein E4